MATYKVRDPQGNIREISGPDGASDAEIIAQAKRLFSAPQPKREPLQQIDVNGPKPESMGPMEALGGLAMGGLRGAARMGSAAMYVPDRLGMTGRTPEQREQSIDQFMGDRADTNSLLYKGGDIGAQIAGTAGVGGLIGKGMRAVPALAKFAPVVESGGFKLGDAATKSAMVNAMMRAGGGAATGAAATAMVDPESIGQGAAIGGATPLAVQGAAKVGTALGSGLRSGAENLMQSALKPSIESLRKGDAKVAIETLLAEGINPTTAGVRTIEKNIGGINDKIDALIKGSTANVNKQDVINALVGTNQRFAKQVAPTADLAAIQGVADDFIAHPMLSGPDIPVQLAQELKKGTYSALKGKYGEVGSAATEAQKALARGLKERIAAAVPEVSGLNARESALLKTLDVAERRALMDANKNPMGLALLASNPATWAAFMADRSAAFKGVAARLANNASKAANATKALENFAPPSALITAPAVTGAAFSGRE